MECVPLTIPYPLHFLLISQVWYIADQWGNATFCLHILSWHFLLFFIKKFVFLFIYLFIYSFIYLWNINFPQENIDELETGIGDRKLSVELCGELILFLAFCIIFVDEICQHLGKSLFTAILQILWQKQQLGVALVLSSNLLHLFYLSHHMWSFLKWPRK